MAETGLLMVLSGPSGAGKSTVVSALMRRRKDVRFSVSATTRAPRPGERDGVDYYFLSREAFDRLTDQDAFLEQAEYVGNRYGTPAEPVDRLLSEGWNVLLDIEVQGASQVLRKRPEAVSVFLAPPSLEELERRLRGRATDGEEAIARRLETARKEWSLADRYTYYVINDRAEDAAGRLDAIFTAERCRRSRWLEHGKEIQSL